ILQSQPIPQPTPPKRNGRGKAPLILLIMAVLLVVIAAGVGAYTLLGNTSTPSATVTGAVHFSRSSGATTGAYDRLEIDLANVPAPPSGRIYYAWIESLATESDRPHWQLTYKQGGHLHETSLSYKQ